jgi:hypothetical protein
MISQKLSEPLHNLIMKSEPALADLHRIPDATGRGLKRLTGVDRQPVKQHFPFRTLAQAAPAWSQSGENLKGQGQRCPYPGIRSRPDSPVLCNGLPWRC